MRRSRSMSLFVDGCVFRYFLFFFFSSRRRHTRWPRDWSSDVCSSDLPIAVELLPFHAEVRATMGDQLVGFFKRALVEQELDALARRHLAFFMLDRKSVV